MRPPSNPVLDVVAQIRQAPDRAAALLRDLIAVTTFPVVQGETATFLFYDTEVTDGVRLVHWVFGLESHLELTRIGETQAFYLTMELPKAARVEYKFAVQRGERTLWMRDPLNPRQAFDPFGSNSVCPMPQYVDPTWAKPEPGARRGSMQRFYLKSGVWGDTRRIDVYLPAEYSPSKRYPLMVALDGDDYRRFAGMRVVLDNLIHRHEVQPLIVAFTSGVNRNSEYAANPTQTAFLVDELLPAVRKRYPTLDGVENTGLCGASFGGVTTLHTAWQRPGVFGKLLLQSGSFVFSDVGEHGRSALWDPVVDFVTRLREDPGDLDAKIYCSCGTFESLIAYNRALVPLLREHGLDLRYVEAQDGHNWIAWRDRLREGLTWLFPRHLWMTYE